MASKKDVQLLIKKARKQGWTVEVTRGSHLKWLSPDGEGGPYFSSSSPSDHRAIKNMEKDLARRGLVLA